MLLCSNYVLRKLLVAGFGAQLVFMHTTFRRVKPDPLNLAEEGRSRRRQPWTEGGKEIAGRGYTGSLGCLMRLSEIDLIARLGYRYAWRGTGRTPRQAVARTPGDYKEFLLKLHVS